MWLKPGLKGNLFQSLKEVLKFNTPATIMKLRGHTRPNCYKLHALKKADSQRLKGQGKGNWNAKQSKGREAIKWTIYIFYLTIVLQDFLKS